MQMVVPNRGKKASEKRFGKRTRQQITDYVAALREQAEFLEGQLSEMERKEMPFADPIDGVTKFDRGIKLVRGFGKALQVAVIKAD